MPYSRITTADATLPHCTPPCQVFSVALSGPLLGQTYPIYVWLSLLPIVAGCSLAAMKEVSFAWSGFNYAMASNLGMVLRNIYSKKSLTKYKVGWDCAGDVGQCANGCKGLSSSDHMRVAGTEHLACSWTHSMRIHKPGHTC